MTRAEHIEVAERYLVRAGEAMEDEPAGGFVALLMTQVALVHAQLAGVVAS